MSVVELAGKVRYGSYSAGKQLLHSCPSGRWLEPDSSLALKIYRSASPVMATTRKGGSVSGFGAAQFQESNRKGVALLIDHYVI